MEFEDIKDLIVIFTPIISAILLYRQNKKSQKEMKIELENKLREMDKETENQKQLLSWENSMPQTNKYIEEIGVMRQGTLSNLNSTIESISQYINNNNLDLKELKEIREMLLRINDLPTNNNEKLYPYEIPILINYNAMIRKLEKLINIKEEK
ncbi:hypothetical protein [Clostridium perfringens]|uniref:hypothetical protein n=1 Tax=Clostridium perfringens TaxID=1502 RepID=UPI002859960F|nr:hypothetical protein [Clostridium perfringens]MDK0719533.1 hypothetical protein [Clostridium perfringens]MDM0581858.1 hypothetical protein [Clostridium perfringens]MDM0588180.1 hypothetical protein [Clostridium perfringens]MDM0591121.1 hypothetical protein [Clostridium perfringens]